MKRLMKMFAGMAAVAMLALVMAPMASAQPKHLRPGSALIFPLYDASPGAGTVVCVTNTNTDTTYCEDDDVRGGDVIVHYQYIDGADWREFDRYEVLTPGDTLCVIVDNHNPEADQGFLIVTAENNQDFDYLIGSAIVVQSSLNFLWSYTPYAFEANPGGTDPDACDNDTNVDVDEGDGDGAADFDGNEYDWMPEEVFVDSFFEEGGMFENSLTLLTTTGEDYQAEVAFLFWNNIEQKFSRSFRFTCWAMQPLSEISAIAANLGGDEDELGVAGVETGWASIRGTRTLDGAGNSVGIVPPLLGVFNQLVSSTDFSAGHALHYRGTLWGELLVGDGSDSN